MHKEIGCNRFYPVVMLCADCGGGKGRKDEVEPPKVLGCTTFICQRDAMGVVCTTYPQTSFRRCSHDVGLETTEPHDTMKSPRKDSKHGRDSQSLPRKCCKSFIV